MEIVYKCNWCGTTITKIVWKTEDIVGYMTCYCGGVYERTPLKGPSSTVVEVRDNGIMPRRVEQQKDIAEVLKERSDKNKKKS